MRDKMGYKNKMKGLLDVYQSIVVPMGETFKIVEKEGKFGFINAGGKIICEIKYDDVLDFENGFAAVKANGKWGFINEDGKEICDLKYDTVYSFNNGFAAVRECNASQRKREQVGQSGRKREIYWRERRG